MAVPALTTTNVGIFSWYRQTGTTQVTLADCLSALHTYKQYSQHVDGTIKIFDTGAESAAPNNYNLVNVRIRQDGYILAWFARELTPLANQTIESATTTVITMSSTKCQIQNYHDSSPRNIVINELAGNVLEFTSGTLNGKKISIRSNTETTITLHDKYDDDVDTDVSGEGGETFRIYSSRGNLVWWGHTSSESGVPTDQSTRLGRALYELWETLKGNQIGGSGDPLDYNDVNYYDYEYINATSLYVFGHSAGVSGIYQTNDKYFYFTVPSGRTTYFLAMNIGYKTNGKLYYVVYAYLEYNTTTMIDVGIVGTGLIESEGYLNTIVTETPGVRNTIHQYIKSAGSVGTYLYFSTGIVILTDG